MLWTEKEASKELKDYARKRWNIRKFNFWILPGRRVRIEHKGKLLDDISLKELEVIK